MFHVKHVKKSTHIIKPGKQTKEELMLLRIELTRQLEIVERAILYKIEERQFMEKMSRLN